MVSLQTEDRQQLIALLKDVPELSTERSRQKVLENAGLQKLIPMMDLSGATFIAVSEIVSHLERYGRLSYEREALGVFLNTMKSIVGIQQQGFLDKLLTDYDMMTPIAALPDIADGWKASETPADVFEKIIGENTLRPIAFLQEGLKVARSVAYIGVRSGGKSWSGTGFLVSNNLLLTNNHVISNPEVLKNTIFRFNYEETFRGEAQKTSEYRAKSQGLFHTNPDRDFFDYTLVELEGEPGQEWGYLPLASRNLRRDDRVNIIQHPLGQPKQISLQNNFVQYVGGSVAQYVTSTQPGSSGSPVFDDAWEVVALHHAGGEKMLEPTTQRRYFRNEGILVNSILADLPPELQAKLAEAGKNKDF